MVNSIPTMSALAHLGTFLKDMKINIRRIAKKNTYTIGKLYIDGEYFCDTIEDKDRGLKKEMTIAELQNRKIYGQTAIPAGTYNVTMKVQSPKYSKRVSYAWCKGYLPRLLDVPAYDGVLIHAGNTAKDSAGCILVGRNKVVGKVLNSMVTLKALYAKMKQAKSITLTIG